MLKELQHEKEKATTRNNQKIKILISKGKSLLHFLFTCQQGHAQNPPSQASTVHVLRTSRCRSWIQKKQRNQISNFQHPFNHRKTRELKKKIQFCFIDYVRAFDCVYHNKLWKILKEMGVPDHLTCLWRNLYMGQEAISRNRYGTTDGFKVGKRV